MSAKPKALWNPDWTNAPSDTIGACFNSDGVGWWWNVKPEIKGNEKHPTFLRWRGPIYGEGYAHIGVVAPLALAKLHWKDSWLEKPQPK
jgi:hypothetical protein